MKKKQKIKGPPLGAVPFTLEREKVREPGREQFELNLEQGWIDLGPHEKIPVAEPEVRYHEFKFKEWED